MNLSDYQERNCRGCKFADTARIGTGKPCCTRPTMPEAVNFICQGREEA